VFQVAIGGGEPFLRKDILKILEYLHKKGMMITISTNGSLLNNEILKEAKNYGKVDSIEYLFTYRI